MSRSSRISSAEFRISQIQDTLNDWRQMCEAAADLLEESSEITVIDGKEYETISVEKVSNAMVIVDDIAGFPGEDPVRGIVNDLEEMVTEVEELAEELPKAEA